MSILQSLGDFFQRTLALEKAGTVLERALESVPAFWWLAALAALLLILLWILVRGKRNQRTDKAAGFESRCADKKHKSIVEAARVTLPPDMPDRLGVPFRAYARAFAEANAETAKSVSTMLMTMYISLTIGQLERMGLRKELIFRADKTENTYRTVDGIRDESSSIRTVRSFVYGSAEVIYRSVKNGRIRKKLSLPNMHLELGFAESLEPKSRGSKVNCTNCGAVIELAADEEQCPYCDSRYRYGHFHRLLNTLGLVSDKYDRPLALALVIVPTFGTGILAGLLLKNLFTGLFAFVLSFILITVIAAYTLEKGLGGLKARTRAVDEGLNKTQVAAEAVLLLTSLSFEDSEGGLEDFLGCYVHPDGHRVFRDFHRRNKDSLADMILRTSHVDRIEETPRGQLLDVVVRVREVRKNFFGVLTIRPKNYGLTLWREPDSKTKAVEGLALTKCGSCGGQVSLYEYRRCPHCSTTLPLHPQIWRLYGIR